MSTNSWWKFIQPEYAHLGDTPLAFIAMSLDCGREAPRLMYYQSIDQGGTACDEYIYYDPPITLKRILAFPAEWEAPHG